VYVNVRNDADAYAFVDGAESPVWSRTHNLFRADGAHNRSVRAEDIEPAVKMMTAVSGIKTAAHFSDRGNNFVWSVLRIDRP